MSGRPYPEGVAEVRQRLRLMSSNEVEAIRLLKDKAEIDARLLQISDENNTAWREAFELLGKMNMQSSGNFGYEQRLSWFLRELVAPTDFPVTAARVAMQPLHFINVANYVSERKFTAEQILTVCKAHGLASFAKLGEKPELWTQVMREFMAIGGLEPPPVEGSEDHHG